MTFKGLIEKYKNYRKQGYLNSPSSFKAKYAFIGTGNHSISNLYPVLDYLGVPIKYIGTKSANNAQKMASRYNGAIGTNDLDLILEDKEVKGVFICSSPQMHFELSKKFLEANKSVFVEKPPCSDLNELKELNEIINKTNKHFLIGLQKRYSTIYSILKNRLKSINTYNLKFLTGAYPEGDEILDLFIHPLDLIVFLFDELNSQTIKCVKNGKNLTVFLIANHENGIVGNIELSTNYSWDDAMEHLIINTSKGIYETNGFNDLTFVPKSPGFMGIPVEKVFSFSKTKEIIFRNTGFVPVGKYNQIYTQGYYKEIRTFLNLVEGKKTRNKTSIKDIIPTFVLMEEIRKMKI